MHQKAKLFSNGGHMDCEYLLVCRWGTTEVQRKFHAATPEEAEETACLIIKTYQKYYPEIVNAELYRQFKEFVASDLATVSIRD